MRASTSCRRAVGPAVLLALGACAPIISTTPVSGEPAAVSRLAGEWEGTYESSETGRSGTITFRLRAGADTAEGDIVMLPAHAAGAGGDDRAALPAHAMGLRSNLLTIRFVFASRDEIEGVLDPYRDPACGCTLTTRFRGVVSGNVIEGTYTSEGSGISHLPTSGRWRVTRAEQRK